MDDPLGDGLRRLRQGRAGSADRHLPPRTVLRLQQTLGNREVVRLLAVSPSSTPPASCAPTEVPRVPLRTRLAIAWGRMKRGKAGKD
ncbi:hypothetical protein ACQ858_12075 [Variovorax ureilyticus]|uniref:hypothetical protein n=1 Tax=Variovorax ureilyticus TaxID=1836198 RepID=UPI003D666DE8